MKKFLLIALALISYTGFVNQANATTSVVCNHCSEDKRKIAALETVYEGLVEVIDYTSGQLWTYTIDADGFSLEPANNPYYSSYPNTPRFIVQSFNHPDSVSAVQEVYHAINTIVAQGGYYSAQKNTITIPLRIIGSASQLHDAGVNADVQNHIRTKRLNHVFDMLTARARMKLSALQIRITAKFSDLSTAEYILVAPFSTIAYALDIN